VTEVELYGFIKKVAFKRYSGRLDTASIQDIISDAYLRFVKKPDYKEKILRPAYVNVAIRNMIKELPTRDIDRLEKKKRFERRLQEIYYDRENRSYSEESRKKSIMKLRLLLHKNRSRKIQSNQLLEAVSEVLGDEYVRVGDMNWHDRLAEVLGINKVTLRTRMFRFFERCRKNEETLSPIEEL